ncbi:AprI/Inh family metalloprotease inhibitor [Phenylobacterium sp.]|uniref:AprI/Inh family metalloprotease inhibitor n=1 Tax=Phenylobacterium sp. TaxID=1871053 RepID=UPI003BAC9DC0
MLNAGLAVAFLALAAPASAAPKAMTPANAPGAFAGVWSLAGVNEGDAACTLTLRKGAAIGGWRLAIPRRCFTAVGLSRDVAAWTVYPNGAIGLTDPLRHALLRFEPKAQGAYVAEPVGGSPLVMEKLGSGGQ